MEAHIDAIRLTAFRFLRSPLHALLHASDNVSPPMATRSTGQPVRVLISQQSMAKTTGGVKKTAMAKVRSYVELELKGRLDHVHAEEPRFFELFPDDATKAIPRVGDVFGFHLSGCFVDCVVNGRW